MESPFEKDLYNINVLVFTETAPQSDQYYQIELTKEQYIKLLDFLETNVCEITKLPDESIDIAVPTTDEDPVYIPNKNAHT